MAPIADSPAALRAGIWAAAALSAGASLLHWITTSTDTHSWSADAFVSLLAGAALMGLAIALAARPWGPRATRTIFLVGAVGTAVVVATFLLPVLSGATTGHAVPGGHPGHDVGGGALETMDVLRMTMEVALVGALVWLHRRSGQPAMGVTPAAG